MRAQLNMSTKTELHLIKTAEAWNFYRPIYWFPSNVPINLLTFFLKRLNAGIDEQTTHEDEDFVSKTTVEVLSVIQDKTI